AARRRARLHGCGRSRAHEGLHVCRRRQRQGHGGRGAGRARRPRGQGARRADRNGRRSGRTVDGDLLCRRNADARAAGAGASDRHAGWKDFPAGLHVGPPRDRHPAPSGRNRDLRPVASRITMLRVVSGTLKQDSNVYNQTRDAAERFGHLLVLQGKTQTQVSELKAGDLGAVAKLKDTRTNDVLADKSTKVKIPEIKFPEAVLAYAIEPKSRGDEDKISGSMQRLKEEDPSISYTLDPQTHELLLAGQGQLHIEVTVAKLKRRFGVEVNLKPPRIPYRETITASTEAHGRHKKQTGG